MNNLMSRIDNIMLLWRKRTKKFRSFVSNLSSKVSNIRDKRKSKMIDTIKSVKRKTER